MTCERTRFAASLAIVVALAGCRDAAQSSVPRQLALSKREWGAIVAIGTAAREPAHCSGVLVSRSSVVTALHCAREDGLVVSLGEDPKHPLFQVAARVQEEDHDSDLLWLEVALPQPAFRVVTPLAVSARAPRTGESVLALGFGARERMLRRVRHAHRANVREVGDDSVTIATLGGEGACRGDSGGPLVAYGPDGVRVLGVLRGGSSYNRDVYRRLPHDHTEIAQVRQSR